MQTSRGIAHCLLSSKSIIAAHSCSILPNTSSKNKIIAPQCSDSDRVLREQLLNLAAEAVCFKLYTGLSINESLLLQHKLGDNTKSKGEEAQPRPVCKQRLKLKGYVRFFYTAGQDIKHHQYFFLFLANILYQFIGGQKIPFIMKLQPDEISNRSYQ